MILNLAVNPNTNMVYQTGTRTFVLDANTNNVVRTINV